MKVTRDSFSTTFENRQFEAQTKFANQAKTQSTLKTGSNLVENAVLGATVKNDSQPNSALEVLSNKSFGTMAILGISAAGYLQYSNMKQKEG